MRKIVISALFLIANAAHAQSLPREFEGVITYKTTIVLKDISLNLDKLYEMFGKERQYFFKAGKYKWVPKAVKLEYEIFNPVLSPSLIIDKYHSTDTLYYRDAKKDPDTVQNVYEVASKTILNIPCHSSVFTVYNTVSKDEIRRTIYYPSDSLQYARPYYDQHVAMGQGFIARYTKALPLRMELDMKTVPFTIIYEATKIEWKPVSDSEFAVNERLPVRK